MIKYLNKPNLPQNRVKAVLCDYRISNKSIETLNKEGIEVIKTKKYDNLREEVLGHSDMQLHHLGDNNFVCPKSLYDYYKSVLPNANIIKTNELSKKYPNDISLNVANINNTIFHNFKYTDSKIIEYYNNIGAKLININQGYSKCSICVVNEKSIITSDIIIDKIAKDNNFISLYVNSGDIRLNGVSCGLIGGIFGKIDKNTLVVNGNIEKLENYKIILNFCNNQDVNVISLNNDIPYDVGSVTPLFY